MHEREYRQLALREIRAVYRLAYHLAPRADEVDDLVQETYLRAFKAAGGFEMTGESLRPWLFKILHNVANRRFGNSRREARFMERFRRDYAAQTESADGAPALANIAWEQVDGRLKRAVEDLPLGLKAVFLLWALEGMRYREIAEVTGVPVGTVMSRLHRARSILASRLLGLAIERRILPCEKSLSCRRSTRGGD